MENSVRNAIKRNRNAHPKGSCATMQPFRLEDVQEIKKLLRITKQWRNLCLLTLGVNTNLRGVDLCKIKFDDVWGLSAGDQLTLREQKTGKVRLVLLNDACIEAIHKLVTSENFSPGDWLFRSAKDKSKHITPISVSALVKHWAKIVEAKGGPFGLHSLRKTWTRLQYEHFETPIPVLMHCLGHHSQHQTLTYICLNEKDIRDAFKNCI